MSNMEIRDIPDWATAMVEATKEIGIPKTRDDALKIMSKAAYLLLLSKQVQYGAGNLLKRKHNGILTRMDDKFSRLDNHFEHGKPLGKEGIVESYGDLAGYSILAIMLEMGWLDLPTLPENDYKLVSVKA